MTTPIAPRLAEEMIALAAGPLAPPLERRARALLKDYFGVALGGAPDPRDQRQAV